MARRRRMQGRELNGIVLLNKPSGISSNDALQKVKSIYFAAKAGHTGALDPLATGMLPICFGEATKFSQFLLESDKRYRVTAKLGLRTNTSDSDGEVVSERPVNVSAEQLEKAIDSFRGDIMQVPSMFSALKYQGKPLYTYAREGIDIPREPRPITVYEIKLLRFEQDEVELEVHSSKGTYIRTIVDDMGELLGCGAHVIQLDRLQVSNFPVDKMVTLDELESILASCKERDVAPRDELDPLLLPLDAAVAHFEEVNLIDAMAGYFLQGQPVQVSGAPADGLVRVTQGDEKRFIGVAHINEDGLVAPKRLVR